METTCSSETSSFLFLGQDDTCIKRNKSRNEINHKRSRPEQRLITIFVKTVKRTDLLSSKRGRFIDKTIIKAPTSKKLEGSKAQVVCQARQDLEKSWRGSPI